MIQRQSYLNVADNSGAKKVQIIGIPYALRQYVSVGDVVTVTVKEATPNGAAKKGKVYRAVVVRVAKELKRSDGSYIKFDDNAVILLNQYGESLGTRILGPIAREVRNRGFTKIASLAAEVV
ncbi:MAG: 50S ribosomal protein L14 [Hydrogenobaculum sp.]|jgi:large subunit ribosomal protein L14|uniref:50S ribosomal protein L14 n=1 Tax=unclassified Hydrogenobaculum TaxID=2622382 RepID=UPI0001C52222|nr:MULTISPECIES: 50S ribosomal protein L14 [unclassified Hydrogenobaculum]PMP61542.1 MAG: 50S ribosomal protein L14 [Hydrogenobaculum sp.]AEF18679.1 ribosomal protein L14 [Hydrogenobaculum sp. 3684]AEG45967.1 ribosomal protein L14 [Hydrogenobaculum sp. SHO]AGG14610.1 LSU ribosomal protein L14P [Hydrogenobaculum sp. HO]AGH92909.1 LSU ribosomal protein L14P [Hydrogenobaculum sp. SN]